MQVVAVDILGPLPKSTAGNSYILVAGDYFTKLMLYQIRRLLRLLKSRFSPPDQLHSDQEKQFKSVVMQGVCKILWIKKSWTFPYHPQCDGLVERSIRILLSMLAITTHSHLGESANQKCAWLTIPAFMPDSDVWARLFFHVL